MILFESSFENPIATEFEGQIVKPGWADPPPVLERATDVFYKGTHSLHVLAPPRSSSLQYAWKNFSHVQEIYARLFVYFPIDSLFLYPNAWAAGKMEYWLYFLAGMANIETDGTETPILRSGNPCSTWGFLRLMWLAASGQRPEGFYFCGSRWSESEANRVYPPLDTPTADAFPIVVGQWYLLELHHKMASGSGQTDGRAELWVNGIFEDGQYVSPPYLLGENLNNFEPEMPYYGAVEIGNRECPPSTEPDTTPRLEIYVDCLKIATEPIGPEVAVPTKNVYVKSSPVEGFPVFIDGVLKGNTPWTGQVEEGTRIIGASDEEII